MAWPRRVRHPHPCLYPGVEYHPRFQFELSLAFVAVLAALTPLSTAAAADAPSSAFNIPGQARTRTCVAMKGAKVPLRFADGTPTGWFVHGSDPSKQGGNRAPCEPGTMEMDVHEEVTTAGGMKLFFHPVAAPVITAITWSTDNTGISRWRI